ncbi:unnamed protein product [Ostreobium quekettii]|uniref:Uncharacterized protein n=1 Tax=Ostreobium quekettii TaxID=121088 RepID=A0A8S1INF4_9CHLO|nr:unnamed protein product [Ostreobium quekettii]
MWRTGWVGGAELRKERNESIKWHHRGHRKAWRGQEVPDYVENGVGWWSLIEKGTRASNGIIANIHRVAGGATLSERSRDSNFGKTVNLLLEAWASCGYFGK